MQQVTRWRFTVHDYHRMGEAGILHEDARVEPIESQPDITVIRPHDYTESLPFPEDVLLLIEVSDTTLAYDRNTKLPLYACRHR